jgi:hypothetical protein
VTEQPMDYRDYLIRLQQEERMAQRFDALFTKDEDHAAVTCPRRSHRIFLHPNTHAARRAKIDECCQPGKALGNRVSKSRMLAHVGVMAMRYVTTSAGNESTMARPCSSPM